MAEAQDNTPKAEENSVTNPNTQVEERNDVPYTRFQEVNGQKNQYKSENESLKAQLDEVKAAQEEQRQEALKKNSEFETLYNETDAQAKKLAEQNKAMQSDLNSFREGLVNQIPEERRYVTEGMSIANLQKFVQEEQINVNAIKPIHQEQEILLKVNLADMVLMLNGLKKTQVLMKGKNKILLEQE